MNLITQYIPNIGPYEVVTKILTHLENGNSLSIVRIGDGEIILLNNVKDKISKFSKRQIGRELTSEELVMIQENIKIAVLESNILGVPKKLHIDKNQLWGDILEYYTTLKTQDEKKWGNKEFCTIDLHLELLESEQIFHLLSKIDKIVIVSSRDIKEQLVKRFPNIKYIEQYTVPGEQCFETEKNTEINIFKSVDDISKKLLSSDRNGQLLIYGVGPFGKHLGSDFSKMGGVSLDLGSVFDFFVGKITRGTGKGPESYTKPLL